MCVFEREKAPDVKGGNCSQYRLPWHSAKFSAKLGIMWATQRSNRYASPATVLAEQHPPLPRCPQTLETTANAGAFSRLAEVSAWFIHHEGMETGPVWQLDMSLGRARVPRQAKPNHQGHPTRGPVLAMAEERMPPSCVFALGAEAKSASSTRTRTGEAQNKCQDLPLDG